MGLGWRPILAAGVLLSFFKVGFASADPFPRFDAGFAPSAVESIVQIINRRLPKSFFEAHGLTISVRSLSQESAKVAHGYFMHQTKEIIIDPHQTPEMVQSTFFHELGHAIAHSIVSPRDLKDIAEQCGGWHFAGQPLDSMSPLFFKPFSGELKHVETFPTNYSLTNVHEWFAENFERYILSSKKGSPRLEQFLARYLKISNSI